MTIRNVLDWFQFITAIGIVALFIGRYYRGRLLPTWVRISSKSNPIWFAVVLAGALASGIKIAVLFH